MAATHSPIQTMEATLNISKEEGATGFKRPVLPKLPNQSCILPWWGSQWTILPTLEDGLMLSATTLVLLCLRVHVITPEAVCEVIEDEL